jgi:tetratricopeptide (TPR) repeat protein
MFERGLTLATENRDRYQEVRAMQYIALAHLTAGDPPELALEMAKSATDWARKVPMMVGIVYGLIFQGLALSRMGRHDEALATSDEAIKIFDGARPEGAENVYRWRAEILSAAGRVEDATAARTRAAAEVDAKAQKLRDPELRKSYLMSRQRVV